MKDLVVVGASLAGLRAVESARQAGYDGRLTLVGDEPHLPYDRPPLSKEVLTGTHPAEDTTFRTMAQLNDLGVELRLGARATGLDVRDQRVKVGKDSIPYGGIVLATGTYARRLSEGAQLAGVHVIRTRSDSDQVAQELRRGPRLVIIGAGFIGGEVASSARKLGLDVTLLEANQHPLRSLGVVVGVRYAALHLDHGVKLRLQSAVAGLVGTDRVEGVKLASGEVIEADTVIVGAGALPATSWLDDSGLRLPNGILADSRLCAGPENVFAAGDVARWLNPRYERHMRVEHWTNASEQGALAARNLLGARGAREYDGIPYFWSDQHDTRIQFAGDLADVSELMHSGPLDGDGAHVTLYRRHDELAAAVSFGTPALFARLRALLTRAAPWKQALDVVAEWVD